MHKDKYIARLRPVKHWLDNNSSYDQDVQVKFKADFCLCMLGEQSPYFSMTGTSSTRRRNRNGHFTGRYWDRSFGCLHDDIDAHFKKYRKYLKWHLSSVDRGPMHYVPNALYWAGYCGWHDKTPNIEHLKSTIVYGLVPQYDSVDLQAMIKCDKYVFGDWLLERYDALMQKLRDDMVELFGPQLRQVLDDEWPVKQPYIGKYLD